MEYVGLKTSWTRGRYPFIHSMAETKDLIAEIGLDNVGFLLDSWHWYTAGDSLDDLRSLTNKDVVACDLNDAPAGIPVDQQIDSVRESPMATRVIDLQAFLGALVEIGYDGPVRAEPFNKALRETLMERPWRPPPRPCERLSRWLSRRWSGAQMALRDCRDCPRRDSGSVRKEIMSATISKIGKRALLLVTLLCLPNASLGTESSAPSRPDEEARAEARRIVADSGVKGGLVVHLGCGNGWLTTGLRVNDSYLVHGLDWQASEVRESRAYVQARGLYGPVSIDQWRGNRLPYGDNVVNLLVVSDAYRVTRAEVLRVLAPLGVACTKEGDGWSKTVKPWPAEIDEWTHYLHGPDNNAVAQDSVVGPPRHFQWISKPRFSRSHDHLASVSVVVSSGGRLFYIVDEGSIAFAGASARWRLVARDAFSGVALWSREIPVWERHLRDFRSGPADIARRLVAIGQRVYVTLGYDRPVSQLDAATGKTLRVYDGTAGTQEIVYFEDKLLLVLGDRQKDWLAQRAKQIVSQEGYSPPFEDVTPPTHNKQVMAVDAKTGECLWRNAEPYARELLPSTLAAAAGSVFFHNADGVVSLDAANGDLRWKVARPVHRQRLAWSTPTLVVRDGMVYSADREPAKRDGELLWIPSGGYHDYIRGPEAEGDVIAFSAETGERLWSCPAWEGFNAPVDVMIANDLLWTGQYAWGNDPGITKGRDPKTGEVKRRRPSDLEFLPRIGHARCYRAKATEKFLILGRRGVEFVDLETGDMVANRWVRGICQYGVMPGNGLLYIPPHSCACSMNDMLKAGFMALAPESTSEDQHAAADAADRLAKGPAYSSLHAPAEESSSAGEWPTYRHDASRSGAALPGLPQRLTTRWVWHIGGLITSPVIADDILLVASTDTHHVHALDAKLGEHLWSFVAGARIDSPPTIHRGLALFGAADGCVYCLRLKDGELVWRFRAAPSERLIVVDEQLESAWPVSGSILVVDGAAYFVAGRSSYLDGGMWLYKADPSTGRTLEVLPLDVDRDKSDAGISGGGDLPDVLSTDGEWIYMRNARFDRNLVRQKGAVAHLWSSVGFLDDSWWHRTYWQIGDFMKGGWGGWARAGQQAPAGRLLVTDGARVFGYGRDQYDTPGAHVGVDADGVWGPIGREQERWTGYHLFGRARDRRSEKQRRREAAGENARTLNWTRRVPLLAVGMVLSGDKLFIAGPHHGVTKTPQEPTGADPFVKSLESSSDGRLMIVSADDGQQLAEYPLPSPPVFDGMAAANERLFLCTKSGDVVCMSAVP